VRHQGAFRAARTARVPGEPNADPLVIGARRRDGTPAHAPGDDTREVLQDPPCAVACRRLDVPVGRWGTCSRRRGCSATRFELWVILKAPEIAGHPRRKDRAEKNHVR